MNSARRVRQLMADMTVPDKKIFGSISFGNYLRTLLSIPCRTIGRKVPSVLMHFPASATSLKGKALAFWDGTRICIDSENSIVTKLPTREYKAAALIGCLVHEYGHYRFTDMAGRQTALTKLSIGKWYPKLPEELPDTQEGYRQEVEEFIEANKEEHPERVNKLIHVWHDIYNIMEDGYIEECLYHCMSGILVDGLNSLRFFQKESAMALKDMLPGIGEDFDMYDVVSSLLLMYCKFGTLKCNWDNPEESESEPVQWIAEARAYVDQVLYVSSTTRRLKGVHMTFLSLWPIIKEHIEHMPDPSSDGDGGSDSSVTDGSKRTAGMMRSSSYGGSPSLKPVPVEDGEDTGKSGSRTSRKETAKHLAGKDKTSKDSDGGSDEDDSETGADGTSDSADGESSDSSDAPGKDESTSAAGEGEDGDESESDDKASPSEFEDKDGTEKDSEGEDSAGGDADGKEESESHPDAEEHSYSEEDGELDMPDDPDEGSDMTMEDIEESFSASEIEATMRRIETEIKEESAIDTVNEELTHELESEAMTLDYGAAHRGIRPTVERVAKVSDSARELYDSTMDSIKQIAAIAAKRVKPLLKKEDDQNRMAMSGYYSGSKFDATRLVMNDCRVFKSATSPLPDTRVVLSVVVDESGSMGGERIKAARTAAIALYEFCAACKIPCSVIGHTADYHTGKPFYNIYADFETPDALDKYRLLNISAKWDNRDGAAILFAGEHLLKREEPVKLMFIISDGAPLARGYSGPPAEHDMSNIVANLRRKGMTIFAAAIGSDKENIHRIFGEGFLDITEIKTLPDQLLQLVKRYIR